MTYFDKAWADRFMHNLRCSYALPFFYMFDTGEFFPSERERRRNERKKEWMPNKSPKI